MGSTSIRAGADLSNLLTVASFAEDSVWTALVQIFILIAALLFGNILRRAIPFLRKSLIPSALLGGTVVLLLKLIPAVNNFINNDLMEIITYHCLALGFIATALKKTGGNRRTTIKAVLESSVLQGGVYSMQAMLGIGITILLVVAGGFSFAAGGVLLALGFGQGTGQALNYGKLFENDYGFAGGTTFAYIRLVSNHIYKGYEHEGFISMFGMLTGTASNGMILLREIDPKLETPASANMVYSGLPAIAFGGGLLLFLGYCPKGLVESIITFAVLFVAFVVFTLILFRTKIFKRRKRKQAVPDGSEGVLSSSGDGAEEGSGGSEALEGSDVLDASEGTDGSDTQSEIEETTEGK